MITVGENKATLVHGDNHPASFYVGNKLIAGYTQEYLSGKGRVNWTAPYKAALQHVTVKGIGRQRQEPEFTAPPVGPVIAMHDEKLKDRNVDCKIERVNLAPFTTIKETSFRGVTYSMKNLGTLNISGICNGGFEAVLINNLEIPRGKYRLSLFVKGKTAGQPISWNAYSKAGVRRITSQTSDGIDTTTFDDDIKKLSLIINDTSGFENGEIQISLTYDNGQAEFAPYIPDLSKVVVSSVPKNKIKYIYQGSDYRGITYTVLDDGGVQAIGTATGGNSYFDIAKFSNIEGNELRLNVGGPTNNKVYYLLDGIGTFSNNSKISTGFSDRTFALLVLEGTSVNSIFYPNIFDNIEATDYTPLPDGTVKGMTTLSPDMTILTDTPGVNISAKFPALPNPDYPIEPEFLEGAELQCCGENLIKGDTLADTLVKVANGTKNTENETVRFDASTVSNKNIVSGIFKPNAQYTFMFFGKNLLDDRKYTNLTIEYSDGKEADLIFKSQGIYSYAYAVSFPNMSVKSLRGIWGSVGTELKYNLCGIFEGIVPEEDFKPFYDGGTAKLPILRALPDGSVKDEYDVATGKLTRRIKEVTFDGSEYWRRQDAGSGVFRYQRQLSDQMPITPDHAHIVCNKYQAIVDGQVGTCFAFRYSVYIIPDQKLDTAEKWKQFLAGNPVKLWYALETPVIEQYDPAIIRQHPGYTQLIQQGGFEDTDISAEAYLEANV